MRILSLTFIAGFLATNLPVLAQPAQDNGGVVLPAPVNWHIRSVLANERLLRWRPGISAAAFGDSTMAEAGRKAGDLLLGFIEGSSSAIASPEIRKPLDAGLTAEERNAVRGGLGLRMLTYRLEKVPEGTAGRREALEFAKAMGAETVVARLEPQAVADLDRLAGELELNVALIGAPADVMRALEGRSRRLSVAADTGAWLEAGIKPMETLPIVKDRVVYVSLRDRSAVGSAGRDVLLGEGVGDIKAFLRELSRAGVRPLVLSIDRTEAAKSFADVAKNANAFEDVVRPALGDYVTRRSAEFPSRGLQNFPAAQRQQIESSGSNYLVGHQMMNQMNVNLSAEVRRGIEAAIPAKAYVTPKKARKVLVIDACVANMSHNTIPHGNLMIELMAKKTGAFEAEFSNNFNNLKYPKIKEYDAIFLNNTVGELFPDPEVREGLTRFVQEGGGLGALHGATYASRNWRGLGEMLGAQDAPHRIEPGTLRVDDPRNPIMQAFGGKDLEHREEYYRFPHEGPTAIFSRDKVRVLLTVEFPPPATGARVSYQRPDNDYAVSWIKKVGQGRTFNCSLGHMPETFMTPQIVGHLLGAIQFLTGDLEVDTTPKPKLAAKAP